MSTETVFALDVHVLRRGRVHALRTAVPRTGRVVVVLGSVPPQSTPISEVRVLQVPLLIPVVRRVEPGVVQTVSRRGRILRSHVFVDRRVLLRRSISGFAGHESISSRDLISSVRVHMIDVEMVVRARIRF